MTVRIDGTNSTANPAITGADTDTGLQFGTNEVKIVTGGTDRVTVDSSGHVAVGGTTVTDTNLLNLQGSSASANIGVVFNDTNTSKIYGIQNGDSALKFFDYTASNERMRIQSGGGISFNGDTAAANALDDYEEGTFDPDITVSGTGATFSYNTNGLGYIKIGRMVQITGRLQITRSGTGTGVLQFELPFTADNSISGSGSPWMSHGSCFSHAVDFPTGSSGAPFFWEINSTTHAGWFYLRDGSSWEAVNPNNISTGSQSYLTFTMTYRAAA